MAPTKKRRVIKFFNSSKNKDRDRNGSADSVHPVRLTPDISAPLQTSPGFNSMVAVRGQQNSAGSTEHTFLLSFPFNRRKLSGNTSLRNAKQRGRKDSDQSGLSGRGDGTMDLPGLFYSLDTNLNDMKGIVKPSAQAARATTGDSDGWNAPDSWNVTTKEKRELQYESRADEVDDDKPIWSVMVSSPLVIRLGFSDMCLVSNTDISQR